jgi:ribosome-associated protein
MAKDMAKKLTKRSLPPEVRLAVKVSQGRKAEDILVLDLRDLTSFTDFFVIMTGNSSRQNVAITESVEQELKQQKKRPLGIEGTEQAEWILMDYGHFVIHVFSRRARDYYSLEKLWGDAPKVAYAQRP